MSNLGVAPPLMPMPFAKSGLLIALGWTLGTFSYKFTESGFTSMVGYAVGYVLGALFIIAFWGLVGFLIDLVILKVKDFIEQRRLRRELKPLSRLSAP